MWTTALHPSGIEQARSNSESFDKQPKRPSPLSAFNFKAFLLPALMIVGGIAIWLIIHTYTPENYALLLWAEILVAVGLFVAFLMGVWVMTLVRVPGKRFVRV